MPVQAKRGKGHKGIRSGHKKGYYEGLRRKNELKVARRAADRQRRQNDYADGTRISTKAQIRRRRVFANRRMRKAKAA